MSDNYITYRFGKIGNFDWERAKKAKHEIMIKRKNKKRFGIVKVDLEEGHIWGLYLTDYVRKSPRYEDGKDFYSDEIIESKGIEFVITKEGFVAIESTKLMSFARILRYISIYFDHGEAKIYELPVFPRKYFSQFFKSAKRVSSLKFRDWGALPPNPTESDAEIKKVVENDKDIIKSAIMSGGRGDLRNSALVVGAKTYSDITEIKIIDGDGDLRLIVKAGRMTINYKKKDFDSKKKLSDIAKEIVEFSKTMSGLRFSELEETKGESDED